MRISEWREDVYGVKATERFPENWEFLRASAIARDRSTCMRCDKQYKRIRHLSVHHLIPRSEGGADCLENLITLCHSCHNYIELTDIRTKAGIMGSYNEPNRKIKYAKEKPLKDREDTFERPEWHKYVYGGAKRN